MSNVSIFEKKWIDLVFEGKNKEYGAYQLRQESPKTTLKAFFFGFILIVSGTFLLSSFDEKPVDEVIITLHPSEDFDPVYPINEPKKELTQPKKEQETPAAEVPENPTPVVVVTSQADPVIPRNDEQPQTNTPSGGVEGGNGTAPTTTTSGGNGGGTGEGEVKTLTAPVPTGVLDAQPEFPGGMKKFYSYVGDNFEKQEIENVESLTVHVSFVIEKDGSMTDIRVLRNPGYGLDKEAIRVLKSLKTKWKPGVLNGQNVRTQYTLPITVMVN